VTVADVFGDGSREQINFLRDHRYLAAEALLSGVTNVGAINADGTALRIVTAQKQIHERGLAGATSPYESHGSSGWNFEADILQCPMFAARIAE
jgi:hypothetical protein